MTTRFFLLLALALLSALQISVWAEDFHKLDKAMPKHGSANMSAVYPVFDFHDDSCFPSAAFNRIGKRNAGSMLTAGATARCRNDKFMDFSNTYHRYACAEAKGDMYCAHSFALYFIKNQGSTSSQGHRHDWQHVIVWTKGGAIKHLSYSGEGGDITTTDAIDTLANAIPMQSGHPKFVFYKEMNGLHSLRLAELGEIIDNPLQKSVTPTIVSWFTMKGDKLSNEQLRVKVNKQTYGVNVKFQHQDKHFAVYLETHKPKMFPSFPSSSITSSM